MRKAIAVAALFCGLVALGAESAAANEPRPAPAPPASTVHAPPTPPPSCVTTEIGQPGAFLQTITLHNNCTVEQRIMIIGAFVNSGCLVMTPRTTLSYDIATAVPYVDAFRGLEGC